MPVFNLKNVMSQTPSRFTAGHRMCTGCRSTTNSENGIKSSKK